MGQGRAEHPQSHCPWGADARPAPQAAVALSRPPYRLQTPRRSDEWDRYAASTATGIGVPLGDGGTSHATALASPLRSCHRPVHSAPGVDGRLPITARLRTPHKMVRGRRAHHRRDRTPSGHRSCPHLGSSPARRSMSTATARKPAARLADGRRRCQRNAHQGGDEPSPSGPGTASRLQLGSMAPPTSPRHPHPAPQPHVASRQPPPSAALRRNDSIVSSYAACSETACTSHERRSM